VRSPMAEALARKITDNKVYVASVGLRRGKIDSFAAEVLREIGIEGGLRAPRTFEDFEDEAFDLVVSLTPEARDRIAELARGVPTELAYWPTPDPTLVEGARESILNAYRAARDGLARQIRDLFAAGGAR
jgi:protein-tyrosine-phosphatase